MTLVSNAKWNTLSQIVKVLCQLINIVYLAKIINPSEYGLMAMALVFINLGVLLRDVGTSAVIIQRKDLSNSLLNSVFWLNCFMGIGLGILLCLLSPVIADLYKQPKLLNIILLLSSIFPLSSFAAAHLALLERDSQFRTISSIEITSSVCALAVAVIMARMGFGVYSLIAQAIVLNLISAIRFFYASKWLPSVKFFIKKEDIKSIFSFSANLSLFNFINYFSRNADSFIIGKFMTANILGNYNLAYRIMLFPLQSLTFVATRSLYPVLSKNQDDNEKIRKTYHNCIFVITMITIPLMSGMAFYHESFILLIFGPQWELASKILMWLAPTAIIQSILSASGAVFMAKGRTEILMRLGFLGAVLQISSFVIGVNYSITVFAMLYFIANILNFFPVMFYLLKIINSSFLVFFRGILPIFFANCIMLTFLEGISFLSIFENINSLLILILLAFLGVMVYLTSLLVFSKLVRRTVLRTVLKQN
ncbi:MOP flippase family protein [Klebsiella pneumoniae]|uniref:MOP flippase family protein n=1 Tax=Klebsiella pneumoniae TaxID=573 RepID=UPI0021F340AA|nr:MOP flippase family protein [Klebsiella pneumoniae]MCV6913004.1 MOP flippase family protein [Klebsiella pneumoniae]